jgi:hypothetical protein
MWLNIGMDPNNQYPGSPQGNPYEFILNPDQAPKKKMGGGKFGNHFIRTIVFILGGAILLMIIASFVISALAPKKISTADLIALTQTQAELLRISRQASSDATQQVTKNLATTVEYTMITQQKQTIDVLAKNKVKVSNKELALKQNATTDQKFTTAKSTSTFDQVYTEVLQTSLNDYAATLKQLSSQSATQTERDRMSDYYRQVQQLISQIPYTQDNINSAGTPKAAQ